MSGNLLHSKRGSNLQKQQIMQHSWIRSPNNPRWGWSWLERWMAARPWESRSAVDNNDRASVKSALSHTMSVGEITRSYSNCGMNYENKPSPGTPKLSRAPSRRSPSTPPSKAPSIASVTGKMRPPSPKGSAWGGDEDSRSMFSAQSKLYRRHSLAVRVLRAV
ncbi:hypothetical protein K2173_014397 [Erythroxylum novogranatense]|uniref:DUF4005 domain-containing protein n=1 Tax=Erythroxylum novogranatense TaxID=1862640 RepID=A0AAV8S4Z3_9ROSI|nr:hypothetical protein K2173_014397 [Erythroxylum novogranatense]